MTTLSVIQAVARRITIPAPSSVVGSSNAETLLLLELLNEEGEDLRKAHDWNSLLVDTTFVCGASNPQSNQFPTAFDRLARGTDIWNSTRKWPIEGPVTSEEWKAYTTRQVVTLPQYWMLIGGVLNIYAPTSGDTIAYQYVSKNWVYELGVAADGATEVGDDTDTFALPEELLKQGVRWRWKQAKGLDYAEDMASYERMKERHIQSDKGGVRVTKADRSEQQRPLKTWPGTITP